MIYLNGPSVVGASVEGSPRAIIEGSFSLVLAGDIAPLLHAAIAVLAAAGATAPSPCRL